MDVDRLNLRLLLIHMVTMIIALAGLLFWLGYIEQRLQVNSIAIAESSIAILHAREATEAQYTDVIAKLERIEAQMEARP